MKQLRRITVCFISSVILILATVTAWAGAPVSQIQAVLVKPEVLAGHFEQTKKLVGIQKPLISSGEFYVVSGKGILWQTKKPFVTSLKITPTSVSQLQGNQMISQLDASQEPMVRMINSVLFSLLAGDLSQLKTLFNMDGSIHGKNWQVALKAKDPAVAKAIGSISLQGDSYVRKVTMLQDNGDSTVILFSAMRNGVTAMNKENEALLAE